MSKFVLIHSLILFFYSHLLAQERTNQVDRNGMKQGIWLVYYSNTDNIKWKYHYKNDQLDSIQISFYKNGKIKSCQLFKEGINNGTFEIYYKNGNLKEKFYVYGDRLEGKYTWYWKSGALFREGTFENDQDHGKSVKYHENGNIWVEETYKYGKLNGTVRKYNSKGKLIKELEFINGKKVK